VATKILTNLLVIGSFGLLRIGSGVRGALQTDLNRADRTSAANALRVAGARLFTPNLKRGDHPDFVGVDVTDYRRLREQRQTEVRGESIDCRGRKIEEVRSEIEEVNSRTARERPQHEFLLLRSHFYLLQSIFTSAI